MLGKVPWVLNPLPRTVTSQVMPRFRPNQAQFDQGERRDRKPGIGLATLSPFYFHNLVYMYIWESPCRNQMFTLCISLVGGEGASTITVSPWSITALYLERGGLDPMEFFK